MARWRCSFCQRTFAEYPPFALPFNRYAVSQIAPRALNYVQEDGISYRKAVLQTFMPTAARLRPVAELGRPSEGPRASGRGDGPGTGQT